MKRFILSLTAAAVLSMPMAASALEKMDNNQLKSSTGQAGVSIAVDDVVIYQKSLADTTYWDTDGLGAAFTSASATVGDTSADVGAAGIKIDHQDEMKKLITIDAILDAEEYGVTALKDTFGNTEDIGIIDNPASELANVATGDYDPSNGNIDGMTTGISPLTIDVGTCKALTRGWDYNTDGAMKLQNPNYDPNDPTQGSEFVHEGAVAGVIIGLPTVEITTYNTDVTKDVKLVLDGTQDAMNVDASTNEATFLRIEKSGNSTMAILGGTLEIAPH